MSHGRFPLPRTRICTDTGGAFRGRGVGVRRRERHDARADREVQLLGARHGRARQPPGCHQQQEPPLTPRACLPRHHGHFRARPACRRASPNRSRPDASTDSRSESSASPCFNPEPVHRPTSCGALRLRVPLAKPLPDATRSRAMPAAGGRPDRRSSVGSGERDRRQLGRTRAENRNRDPGRDARARAVSTWGPASGKDRLVAENDTRALRRDVDHQESGFTR